MHECHHDRDTDLLYFTVHVLCKCNSAGSSALTKSILLCANSGYELVAVLFMLGEHFELRQFRFRIEVL